MNSCVELACKGVGVRVGDAGDGAAISVSVRGEGPAAVEEAAVGGKERTQALEQMMDWFTATLVAMKGETDEEEEANFVLLGRAVLHTQAAEVTFASSVPEMHRDVWRLGGEGRPPGRRTAPHRPARRVPRLGGCSYAPQSAA